MPPGDRTNIIFFLNLTLSSDFIAWSYFHNVFDEIRKLLTIRPQYLSQALAFLNANSPINNTLIGIQVRRSDFISSNTIRHGRVAANMTFFTTYMAYFRDRYRDTFLLAWAWLEGQHFKPCQTITEKPE